MTTIITISIIGIGAAIGASLRYYLSVLLVDWQLGFATLLANVIGSFLAGILLVVIVEKSLLSEAYRLMLIVGLCGSLTTFSAFSVETVEMLSGANFAAAFINILLNLALSLAGVISGVLLMRNLL